MIENFKVYNILDALRGMRNPLESWDKSDSHIMNGEEIIGEKDMELAMKLIRGGSPHRKFLRQILVSMDLKASSKFWVEYATYKVATVEDSTSIMHMLGKRTLTKHDFTPYGTPSYHFLDEFNEKVRKYQKEKKKEDWLWLVYNVPHSYLYLRTCTLNYEVLYNMIMWRKNHKLPEWRDFCTEVIEQFPYAKEFFEDII